MFKLKIDEREYVVSPQAIDKFISIIYDKGVSEYNKQPVAVQSIAGGFARKKIYELEKQVFERTGNKEMALSFRPQKGEDFTLRLASIIIGGLKEILDNAEIGFSTDNNAEITDFTYKLKD